MKNQFKKIVVLLFAVIALTSCSKEGLYAQCTNCGTQQQIPTTTTVSSVIKMAKLVPNQRIPQPGDGSTFFVDYPANGVVDSYRGQSYGAPKPSHFGIYFYDVDQNGVQVSQPYVVMVPASQEPLDRLRWNPNAMFPIVGSSAVIGSSAILPYYDTQNKIQYGLNPSGQVAYFILQ